MKKVYLCSRFRGVLMSRIAKWCNGSTTDSGSVCLSVIWAFAQYIGDPGNFADTPPITFTGRIIACIIGILGIAIFAVPAGLIGSAFTEVMEKDEKREKAEKILSDLKKRLSIFSVAIPNS